MFDVLYSSIGKVLPNTLKKSFVLQLATVTFLVWFVRHLTSRYHVYQLDKVLSEKHGCRPAPNMRNRWPLGIDRLLQILKADADDRLMDLFHHDFQDVANTIEHGLLGSHGFRTNEPSNIAAMLSSQFEEFGVGLRRPVIFPLLGDGIFTQDGAAWRHSRAMLRPQFSKHLYQDLSIFCEHVDNLIARVAEHGHSLVGLDMQPLFFRLTLDVSTTLLFDDSTYSLRADWAGKETEFAKHFAIAQDFVVQRFRYLNLYWLAGGRPFLKACASVHQFVDNIIERRETNLKAGVEGGRYYFIDAIANETQDRKALRSQLINTLLAGRDTTAVLLTWTFYLLPRYPDVLQRVRAEINSVFGPGEELTRDGIRKMKYLANVLKETLRLFPPIPLNIKTVYKTTTLPRGGGPDGSSPLLVREGDTIAFIIYSTHRRKDLYGEDAEEFRPERWEGDMPLYHDEVNANWSYLSFNGGPRHCLGQDFALIEASYTIIRILQAFPSIKPGQYERPQSQEWLADSSSESGRVMKTSRERQKMTLVMSLSDGCPVVFG